MACSEKKFVQDLCLYHDSVRLSAVELCDLFIKCKVCNYFGNTFIIVVSLSFLLPPLFPPSLSHTYTHAHFWLIRLRTPRCLSSGV